MMPIRLLPCLFVLAAGPAMGQTTNPAGSGYVSELQDETSLADLSGEFTNGKITLIAGGAKVKVKGNLTLTNSGNKKATNFDVTAYLAPAPTFDSTVDTYLGSFHFLGTGGGKLKAGAAFTLPFRAVAPSNQFEGGEYLLIVVDSGETVEESNESNNVVTIGPLPTP